MKAAFRIFVAETFWIDQPYSIELMSDSILGSLVNDFSFVECFSDDFEKIVEYMLLRPIVEEAIVVFDTTDVIEAKLLLKDSLFEVYTGQELFGHFTLEYPLSNLC